MSVTSLNLDSVPWFPWRLTIGPIADGEGSAWDSTDAGSNLIALGFTCVCDEAPGASSGTVTDGGGRPMWCAEMADVATVNGAVSGPLFIPLAFDETLTFYNNGGAAQMYFTAYGIAVPILAIVV